MSDTTKALDLEIGKLVMDTVGEWQNNSARTQQSTRRILGMSELGGCREYIRASIAGDPKAPGSRLKWPAFVGTAVGDFAERALEETLPGSEAQRRVTVKLPQSGIEVSGSTDSIMLDLRLLDFKTRDGLEEVMRDGPPFKERVQISGYLTAAIAEGRLPAEATGHLVYLDRSGKNKKAHVWGLTAEEAADYLRQADERLLEVATALATGERAPRDEPESYCWHIECPFYNACWEGHQPTSEITHPDQIRAVEMYAEGRDMKKAGEKLQDNAKAILNPDPERDPVEGNTPTHSIKWTLSNRYGRISQQIDVRARRTTIGSSTGNGEKNDATPGESAPY